MTSPPPAGSLICSSFSPTLASRRSEPPWPTHPQKPFWLNPAPCSCLAPRSIPHHHCVNSLPIQMLGRGRRGLVSCPRLMPPFPSCCADSGLGDDGRAAGGCRRYPCRGQAGERCTGPPRSLPMCWILGGCRARCFLLESITSLQATLLYMGTPFIGRGRGWGPHRPCTLNLFLLEAGQVLGDHGWSAVAACGMSLWCDVGCFRWTEFGQIQDCGTWGAPCPLNLFLPGSCAGTGMTTGGLMRRCVAGCDML